MAQAALATQIHQALDRHAHLAAQIALDGVLADLVADLLHLAFTEGLDLGGRNHASVHADLPGPAAADTENALQTNPDMLLDRQIDTRNARHDVLSDAFLAR